MKHLKHPATIIATLALFVGLAGGAYASGLINGAKIKNGSISAKKLSKSAVKQLTAPDGTIINYNATATASPAYTPLGTVLGDTLSAACGVSGGDVTLRVAILPSDGSLAADISNLGYDNSGASVFVNSFNIPKGTITSATPISETGAPAGQNAENRIEFTQIAPLPGKMIWHQVATANGSTTCHLSVEYSPESIKPVAGASHATVHRSSNLLGLLGR